jgi:hypothetical protein
MNEVAHPARALGGLNEVALKFGLARAGRRKQKSRFNADKGPR